MDLTIEKRVQTSVDDIRTKAKQEADEAARLRVLEKDQTIESMARTIEELKRKAEQGSQQSQGEVLELELEELLRGKFPADTIEPVAKGELGADVVQQVNGSIGQPAGIILWESKRTKAWSDGWLAKLRDDQRRCGADVALIISHTLPKHIEQFDLYEGVWVAHPRCALPVAVALRQSLIEVSNSRLVRQGQQTKMEQVYQYLDRHEIPPTGGSRGREIRRHARGSRQGTQVHGPAVGQAGDSDRRCNRIHCRHGRRPAGNCWQGDARDPGPRDAFAGGCERIETESVVIGRRSAR
jgi:hypothetical protein